MIKAVLIDLGKTIVTNDVIDFKKCLFNLYENLCSKEQHLKKISFLDFYRIFNELKEVTLDHGRAINSDIRLVDVIRCLLNITNLSYSSSVDLEQFILDNLMTETLIKDVDKFLEYLHQNNIITIIVSNSCITSKALLYELESFNVSNYITKIISSSDIYIRKPRREIFEYAIGQVKKIDRTINLTDIIFIGNDYDVDMIGAKNAELNCIWYNKESKQDIYSICDYIFNDYLDLIDYFKTKIK